MNSADWTTLPGGPNPGGHYVRVGLLGDSNRSLLTLPRIPLEAGHSYYFAGWLRASRNGSRAGLSRPLPRPGWSAPRTRLLRFHRPDRALGFLRPSLGTHPPAPRRREFIQIPEKAAFFEPTVLTDAHPCDITSLYFGEISEEPGSPK
ncbi:MAG: hypothetical protein WDN28_12705 [Chthoniobacter sp.]